MTKRTALAEVVETAEAEGWIVQVHPVTRFTTRTATTGRATDHEAIVVNLDLSEEMQKAVAAISSGYYAQKSIVALFRPSGAFHVAFRPGTSYAEMQERAEVVAEERVKHMTNANEAHARGEPGRMTRTTADGKPLPPYSDEEIERTKDRHRADTRYRLISHHKQRLTKAEVLDALVNHPIRQAEKKAIWKAEQAVRQREQEVERLRTKVIPQAEQRRDIALRDSIASLEEVKAQVVAVHPHLFAEAPGLVESIVFALVGEDNDPERPLVRFIHARGALARATEELSKAAEVLGTVEVSATLGT